MTYIGVGAGDGSDRILSVSGVFPSFKTNALQNVVEVAKNDAGDFTSVKAAVESIVDAASVSNEYVVEIHPGVYEEDPFILPTGISLWGHPGAFLKAIDNTTDFITVQTSTRVTIKDLFIQGPEIAGAAIKADGGILVPINLGIQNYACGLNITPNNTFCVASLINFNNLNHPSGTYGTGILIQDSAISGITNTFTSCTFVNGALGIDVHGRQTNLSSSVIRGCDIGAVVESGNLYLQGCDVTLTGTGLIVKNEAAVAGFGLVSDATSTVDLKQEGQSSIFLTSTNVNQNKLEIEDFARVSILLSDDFDAGDAGLAILGGQLSVGVPEGGSESSFGEGDSYTRGMLVYASGAGSGVLTNISTEVSLEDNGTVEAFPGSGIDNAIYFASNLRRNGGYVKHGGFKATLTTLAQYGDYKAFKIQLSTPTGWIDCSMMVAAATGDYLNINHKAFKEYTNQHIRYDINPVAEDWGAIDLLGDGESRYWSRIIIESGITTIPVIDEFRLHSNRMEINNDGWMEYFGTARPIGTINYDAGLAQSAANSPGNQDIYLSDNLDVGRIENYFQNNTIDRIGFCVFAPTDLDTSCPIELLWSYISDSANTGDIEWTIRWAYVSEGGRVYRAQVDAPTAAENERVITVTQTPPGTADMLMQSRVRLNFEGLTTRRMFPEAGDLIFVSIERDGSTDAHTGNVALVNLIPRYYKWCDGGHI